MAIDPDDLGDRVDELGRQLLDVQLRLERLESRERSVHVVGARRAASGERDGAATNASSGEAVASPLGPGSVALLGRALVVLGGAYLIRAVSAREVVPPLAGAAAALLYAALWLVVSDRSAAQGRRSAALVHGVTGVVIGVSLVWETTARLSLINVEEAGIALCGVFALAFGVAIRRDLRGLAWLSLAAHLVAAFAITLGSDALLPTTAVLLASALTVEATVCERWPAMRWPAALGVDAAGAMLVGVAIYRARAQELAPFVPAVIAVLLALPVLYLASTGVRTLRRARPVSVFDGVQAAAALAVGLGGAALVATTRGGSAIPFAGAALLLGAGLYAFGLPAVARRLGRGTSFHVHGAFAAALVLSGLAVALPSRAALALAAAALALAAVALGLLLDRRDLRFHGAAFGVAALLLSGVAAAVAEGMLVATGSWRPVGAVELVVVGSCAAAALALMARPLDPADWLARLPQAALAAAALTAGLGVAVRWLGAWSGSLGDEDAGRAALAAARSVLLALAAIGLAAAARRRSLPELRWIAYPVLAGGAAQLVFEALRVGEPIVLFVALAAYGSALSATSRLLRSDR